MQKFIKSKVLVLKCHILSLYIRQLRFHVKIDRQKISAISTMLFFQYHFVNSTLFYLQRYPTDRAYFIAKEILMTERTYKKDLEILNLVSTFLSTSSSSSCISLEKRDKLDVQFRISNFYYYADGKVRVRCNRDLAFF